jgi:DNA polymerase-3 subunit alpha
MEAALPHHHDAIDRTLDVAEMCDVTLSFGELQLPDYITPDGSSLDEHLRGLVVQGAKGRYGDRLPDEVVERIDYELSVISKMGFAGYFLVVADLVGWAKGKGIRVGPGRGSAAGTITCYSLGITTLDPIRYGLVFERFLNPERREMPDFDIDFDERYRGEVITYLRQKYGEDRVAQIVTFATIKAKSGIRDSARVLGYPYGTGDRLAKMFPRSLLGKDPSLRDCFEKSKDSKWTYAYNEAAELRKAHSEETDARRVLDAALKLEGLRRQTGVHAAAVVVGREPLVNFTALQRTDQGDVVTQYEMHAIEKLGLLKVDILGLGNLTVIELTLELLRNAGISCDIDDVPLDDPKVFELLQRGDVDGVFQLESEGMRRLLKSLRPDRFEDIVALIALYRPGPMQEIDKYIAGKHDPDAVRYPHALLADVLGDTYGVIVYQEQVLQLLQRVAGYTAGEADVVRKAVGKKVESIMKAEEPKFLSGAAAQGLSEEQARYLWELIQPFAGYSFNRAHSACYGLIAYQTAYLKAHHPVEYISALLTSSSDSKDEKTKYLASARKMGVEVLPPDVNLAQLGFAPDPQRPDCVRFGLAGIRNVGEGVVHHIIAARQQAGPFKDFFDFCWRVDVTALNKRTVESMIKAGAFDSMGHQRGGLLEVFEQTVEQIASARRKEAEGYVSLFDEPGGTNGDRSLVGSHLRVTDTELPKAVRMTYEKEMLGNYVTDHPLAGLEEVLSCQTDTSIAALPEVMDGGTVAIAGIVHKIGKKFTRKGELMFILEVEDLEASCEVIVFPQTAEKAGDLVAVDQVLCIRGRVDHKDDHPKVVAMELAEPDYSILDNPLRIRLPAPDCTPKLVAELKAVLLDYPGMRPVFLHLMSGEKETVLRLGADFRVDTGNGCADRLRLLLGADAVTAV